MKYVARIMGLACVLLVLTVVLNGLRWSYYDNGRSCLDKWTGTRYAVRDKSDGYYVGAQITPNTTTDGKYRYDFSRPAGLIGGTYVSPTLARPFLNTACYVFGIAGSVALVAVLIVTVNRRVRNGHGDRTS